MYYRIPPLCEQIFNTIQAADADCPGSIVIDTMDLISMGELKYFIFNINGEE